MARSAFDPRLRFNDGETFLMRLQMAGRMRVHPPPSTHQVKCAHGVKKREFPFNWNVDVGSDFVVMVYVNFGRNWWHH
jgi:hypothetical protein